MSTDDPKILALCGSHRPGSWNRCLLALAAAETRALGLAVTLVDPDAYPLPLYDAELEARSGLPAAARALQSLAAAHRGFLFATPEYNGSLPPLLKNAIDWMTRPEGARPAGALLRGKPAAVLSASPGRGGGLRASLHLREILAVIGLGVVPQQLTLAGAAQAFTAEGLLADAEATERLSQLCRALVRAVRQESTAGL